MCQNEWLVFLRYIPNTFPINQKHQRTELVCRTDSVPIEIVYIVFECLKNSV